MVTTAVAYVMKSALILGRLSKWIIKSLTSSLLSELSLVSPVSRFVRIYLYRLLAVSFAQEVFSHVGCTRTSAVDCTRCHIM